MSFEIDEQTIKDLNLHYKDENSIFNFFNYTSTKKGELCLIEKFNKPSSNIKYLNNRIETIQYIFDHNIQFIFLQKDLEFIEYYLSLDFRKLKDTFFESIKDYVQNIYTSKNDFYLIERGITSLVELLNNLKDYLSQLKIQNLPDLLSDIFNEILVIFTKLKIPPSLKLNFRTRNHLDNVFRFTNKIDVEKLLNLIYEWDVLYALSLAMKKSKFVLPQFKPHKNNTILEIEEFYHPLISNPVKNNFSQNSTSNVCFLTGPNMSGKSTLLKSIGIITYLAHLGFPVPVKSMSLTPFKGVISSINLSDNIIKGFSHYFSEVKRIKYISDQLTSKKYILVIMDEMFRGTNVEEAHYGTNIISSSFANISSSLFLISSHIVEVAEKFKTHPHINLKYLEKDNHNLKTGISNKKLGRKILEDEGVVDSLNLLNERV